MGLTQSALKKEVAALQQEARKRSAKHQEELATAAKDKRQLQAKIDELQALVAQAKEDAELAKKKACEQEERMKALKWELVRQLRLTGSPTSSCQRAPLSPSPSTRIDLNWRLDDDLSVRQDDSGNDKSPREFKTESGSDDSPPKSHRSNDAKAAEEEEDATPLAKHHYQNADGKDSGDESPEINDIRCYSEDKSV
ncbi:hypothetical protein PInf_016337 [Phytophthora infestans]|nr:hypothetical protein PInf_016337 [Phytophthora infestans]